MTDTWIKLPTVQVEQIAHNYAQQRPDDDWGIDSRLGEACRAALSPERRVVGVESTIFENHVKSHFVDIRAVPRDFPTGPCTVIVISKKGDTE
jgi:hypothetical protein